MKLKIEQMFIGLVVILFFLVAMFAITTSNESDNMITVSGNAESEVAPDQATLYLTLETKREDAEQVQDDNSAIMEEVMTALIEEGVNESDIETTAY